MHLTIKNIGKISEANIALDGITVVAGENNTGKSTLGKVLFCLFNSFYEIGDQIRKERENAINNIIFRTYHENLDLPIRRPRFHDYSQFIVRNQDKFTKDPALLENELKDLFASRDAKFWEYINDGLLSTIVKKTIEILTISDDDIARTVLKKRLQAEFNMQISHINNHNEVSRATLCIKDKLIDITIAPNNEIIVENSIKSIYTELIYIDDPFVLDYIAQEPLSFAMRNDNHRNHLKSKLTNRNLDPSVKNVIEELVATNRIDNILNKLGSVCDGELIKTDSTTLAYKSNNLEEALDIANLSTGLKTFVILRTLLTNGSLVENGTIVLDEPEIHLHPEWQLLFAEIIVLIQQEFKMNILLNTHSPYFLNAIEVYAAKYDISDKCKYYLAENQDEKSIIKDVTNNIELIYEKLARPLQDLENERYRHD